MLRNLLSSHHARGVIILTITDLRSNQEHTDEIEAKEVLTKAGLDVLSLSDAGFPQWVVDMTIQGLKLPTFESAYMSKEEIAKRGPQGYMRIHGFVREEEQFKDVLFDDEYLGGFISR